MNKFGYAFRFRYQITNEGRGRITDNSYEFLTLDEDLRPYSKELKLIDEYVNSLIENEFKKEIKNGKLTVQGTKPIDISLWEVTNHGLTFNVYFNKKLNDREINQLAQKLEILIDDIFYEYSYKTSSTEQVPESFFDNLDDEEVTSYERKLGDGCYEKVDFNNIVEIRSSAIYGGYWVE